MIIIMEISKGIDLDFNFISAFHILRVLYS